MSEPYKISLYIFACIQFISVRCLFIYNIYVCNYSMSIFPWGLSVQAVSKKSKAPEHAVTYGSFSAGCQEWHWYVYLATPLSQCLLSLYAFGTMRLQQVQFPLYILKLSNKNNNNIKRRYLPIMLVFLLPMNLFLQGRDQQNSARKLLTPHSLLSYFGLYLTIIVCHLPFPPPPSPLPSSSFLLPILL